jgi:hypothetical protein
MDQVVAQALSAAKSAFGAGTLSGSRRGRPMRRTHTVVADAA